MTTKAPAVAQPVATAPQTVVPAPVATAPVAPVALKKVEHSAMLAKKDFLEMLQASFSKVSQGNKLSTLSRERADEFYGDFVAQIMEKAQSGRFSVRGIGKFYVITTKKGKKYLRFTTQVR